MRRHIQLADLHGYSRLVVDATLGVTDLVEAMHHNILQLPAPFRVVPARRAQRRKGPVHAVLQKSSSLVYGSIRNVTRMVGSGLDAALGRLAPAMESVTSSQERLALISIVNGVLGDHMAQRKNPLTITMGWYQDGRLLELSPGALEQALPQACGRILVMIHGHCMNDTQWTTRSGQNHGAVLAAAQGLTPVALRYNTGLHISQNGRTLAGQLEQLVRSWPVPVSELLIVGYSMGGLLARSAFHYGAESQHGWMGKVRKLFFVGTPHHGSMLERAGNWVDVALEFSPYSHALARLGKIRSAGTTDLRYGNLLDGDWAGRDRFARSGDPRTPVPLPAHVQCYAIAAMVSKEHSDLSGRLVGDGLVPLKSALGEHEDSARALHFPAGHQRVFHGTTHLGLLDSQGVCEQLQQWMAADLGA